MLAYEEVQELGQLHEACALLTHKLEQALAHREERTIGFPSNYFVEEVHFSSRNRNGLWWRPGSGLKRKDIASNFFGHGKFGESTTLNIDLQFNFPAKKFNRTTGGVIVFHRQTGEYLLGHRGIVTRGKSRMPKNLLFAEVDLSPTSISIDSGRAIVDVLLVSPLDDRNLISNIEDFCLEMRRSANSVAAHLSASSKPNAGDHFDHSGASSASSKLTDYFDEFQGRTQLRSRGTIIADWEHGRIVKELKNAIGAERTIYKSKFIDLIALSNTAIILFEVKSKPEWRDIYTGIGQIEVHSHGLKSLFPNRKLLRCLVMPFNQSGNRYMSILSQLNIKPIVLRKIDSGYAFEGLKNLLSRHL